MYKNLKFIKKIAIFFVLVLYNYEKASLRKTISATIGSYAANSQSKSEIFVEGMTKLITAVLNKDDLHVLQNPLNGLKKMSKEVADIIEKTIS